MMPSQIPFDLETPPAFGRADFVESACNDRALAAIDVWPNWGSENLLLLGPTGAGKTHLAHIFAEVSHGYMARGEGGIDIAEVTRAPATILDDADRASISDVEFFHLLNTAREAGKTVLLTARQWPSTWARDLPDLRSRLTALPIVEIAEPDGVLLNAVLVKLFADRQLIPDPTVISYVTRRMERSVSAAIRLVDALDKRALSEKRAVTRAMAARMMAQSRMYE